MTEGEMAEAEKKYNRIFADAKASRELFKVAEGIIKSRRVIKKFAAGRTDIPLRKLNKLARRASNLSWGTSPAPND